MSERTKKEEKVNWFVVSLVHSLSRFSLSVCFCMYHRQDNNDIKSTGKVWCETHTPSQTCRDTHTTTEQTHTHTHTNTHTHNNNNCYCLTAQSWSLLVQ